MLSSENDKETSKTFPVTIWYGFYIISEGFRPIIYQKLYFGPFLGTKIGIIGSKMKGGIYVLLKVVEKRPKRLQELISTRFYMFFIYIWAVLFKKAQSPFLGVFWGFTQFRPQIFKPLKLKQHKAIGR